ncbi:MAG TPA: hypothetical protein VGO86_13410 [Candidatus Dormibacteraeota bacterium]
MTTPRFSETDLDGEVVFDRYIVDGDELDVLQTVLVTAAPRWSSRLRIWKGPRDQRAIDASRPGALREAVLAAASERGPTYAALVRAHGRPAMERISGSAELRGSTGDLVVVVALDEMVVSPLGDRKNLGNGIDLQVRGARVQGRPGNEWLRELFTALCQQLSPAWGWAGSAAEYWAKAISDPPRTEAVGRDFGRHLPGLFWLNFFGRRLTSMIGESRLLSAPADSVAPLDAGVLVGVASDPAQWASRDYQVSETRVRRHLGDELFFTKAQPDRPTTVPDWEG